MGVAARACARQDRVHEPRAEALPACGWKEQEVAQPREPGTLVAQGDRPQRLPARRHDPDALAVARPATGGSSASRAATEASKLTSSPYSAA